MKPLITASDEGYVRMVKLLLDKGADVNLSDQVCMLLCLCIYYTYAIMGETYAIRNTGVE